MHGELAEARLQSSSRYTSNFIATYRSIPRCTRTNCSW